MKFHFREFSYDLSAKRNKPLGEDDKPLLPFPGLEPFGNIYFYRVAGLFNHVKTSLERILPDFCGHNSPRNGSPKFSPVIMPVRPAAERFHPLGVAVKSLCWALAPRDNYAPVNGQQNLLIATCPKIHLKAASLAKNTAGAVMPQNKT
jgi:hypothetical protein